MIQIRLIRLKDAISLPNFKKIYKYLLEEKKGKF